MINSGNGNYLNRDTINVHKMNNVRTKSKSAFDTTSDGINKLNSLMNQTNVRMTKLEITATMIKLGEDISHVSDTIKWMKNNLKKLMYTARLPVNLIDDKSVAVEMEQLSNKIRYKNEILVTRNPFLMKVMLGYDSTLHTLHIILKAPIKRKGEAYKIELLNKYVTGKIYGMTTILEITSPRIYYQMISDGKAW